MLHALDLGSECTVTLGCDVLTKSISKVLSATLTVARHGLGLHASALGC
jgi:hypothetical protein